MSWVSQELHSIGDWGSALTVWQIAEVAPIVTASLTVLAVLFAWRAIHVQKDVARRRAAIDFFLKTEMDKDTLALWKTFTEKSVLFSQWAQSPHFKDEPGYHDVRMFLNVCELIAV